MTPILFSFLLLFQVRGIVSDPSGRPVEDAQVACGAETKSTDAHGAVEFTSPCEALVTKPGFSQQREMLTEGKDGRIILSLAPSSHRLLVTPPPAPLPLPAPRT